MKILIVQTSFLGDVLLSTPVIIALRKQFPDAHIAFLATRQGGKLVENLPEINEILIFDKNGADSGLNGLWRMKNRLEKMRFDVVFSLHKSWRTALLLALSRIPIRYGFSEAHGRFLYTRTVPRSDLSHEVQRNSAILRNLDIEPGAEELELKLTWSKRDAQLADESLSSLANQTLIGLAPGSAWATKRWSVSGYGELGRRLVEEGYGVVILAAEDEVDVANALEKEIGGRVLNLGGKTSLTTAAVIISKLALLVCNDSLPLHLASAVKTPVLALFCSTIPEFGFGPWKTENFAIGVSSLPCRPCGRHGYKKCPEKTYACINDLKVEVVFDYAKALLSRSTKDVSKQIIS